MCSCHKTDCPVNTAIYQNMMGNFLKQPKKPKKSRKYPYEKKKKKE